MKFIELKKRIKELAKEIKEMKGLRKDTELRRNDTRCKYGSGYVIGLDKARYEVRHHHIAYCLLRGRTMEQIEPKTREDNAPNSNYYTKIMNSIEPREVANEEAVCCG